MLRVMPTISRIRFDGDSFYAKVDGEEIRITTFRESLWRQHKVYLPPPFTDACSPQTIYCDAADAWSDPMLVPGCIHDPWTAAKMADFARGRLSNGVYEKPNVGILDSECRYFPDLHRALADPSLADKLPRIQQCRTLEDFQLYWKTLYYLLHALMGWERIGDGLAWWYSSGRNAGGDARLEHVNAIWDDDGQLDYFAGHCWRSGASFGQPEELSPEKMAITSAWRDEDSWRQFKRQLGHKNRMFIGGEHTGWRSAVVYTFVEQIRRHGADPFAYFEWVFEKLMHSPALEELEAMLPPNWIKARPAASQTIESRVA
jgi:hypothetical protein